MNIILLASPGRTTEKVLPALTLLPHKTETFPANCSMILGETPELLLIDGTQELPHRHKLTQELATHFPATPKVLVLSPADLVALSPQWPITDFILTTATPAEIDARIRRACTPKLPTSAPTHTTEETTNKKSAIVSTEDDNLTVGSLQIDESAYMARLRGQPLDLTFREFELLRFLAENQGRVCTRAELLQEVWGMDYLGGSRTVDVHVRRLRAKLGAEHDELIGTVRNVGYRLITASEANALTSEDE